jgi:tetratricopeptide (TPR) repeat protein
VHGRGYQFVGSLIEGDASDPSTAPAAVSVDQGPTSSDDLELALSIAVDDEFPFVGRRDEIDRIEEFVTDSGSSVVLLSGEPGVGKSRLAVEILGRAIERGAIVCAGRSEEHGTFALQPIRDAVAQLAATNPADFAEWSVDIDGQLVALVPALVGQLAANPQPVDGYSSLEVLSTLVERVAASRPTMLLVDDLHWSDDPTRAFVSRLVRRARDLPISVFCTFLSARSELPAEVRRWIGDQERSDRSLRLDLEGLDGDAAAELVGSVLGAERAGEADELVAHTGGNGLFLIESLRDRTLGSTGASSVQQMMLARLDRLTDDVQDLVRAGAILGTEFSFDLASRGADLEPETALTAIDEAIRAELLHETESPSRFRFSHRLVPDSIRASMSRPATALIHHRCAQALDAVGGDDADIAHHLLGAVPLVAVEVAVERARSAASRASERNQFDRAIRLLEQILAVDVQTRTRAEVLLEIGAAMVAAGRTRAAVPSFESAAELARVNGWTDVLVQAALGHYGRSPYRTLHDTSTLELLAEAEAAIDGEPSIERARLLAKRAVFSQFVLPLSTCDEMTRDALEMAPDVAPLDRMELIESRAILFSCPAGVEELGRLDPELERLREENNIYFADAAAPETRLMMIGDGDGLRRVARFDEARVKAQPIAEWRDLTLSGTLAAMTGDHAGAIGEQFWGDSSHVLHALGHVFIGALGGDWTPAAERLDLLLQFDVNQQLVLAAAWAHLAAGNDSRGHEVAASIRIESFRWHPEHIIGGNALIAGAEVALLLDDDRLATAADEALMSNADLMLGVPWAPALAAADSLSRLAKRRGDEARAEQMRSRAADIYRGLDAPALLARVE